jgi:signal transduction histidine kinase
MRERASLAGGFLSIETRPGAGTLVWAGLPLNGRKLEKP